MEIEKKFLVKDISHLDLSNYNKIEMVQDYLYIDKLTIVRKRKCIKNNKTTYTYTIKTDKKNLSVNEIEKEITEDEYNSLPINPNYNSLSKTRYIIELNFIEVKTFGKIKLKKMILHILIKRHMKI